jgi:hypothetical protein
MRSCVDARIRDAICDHRTRLRPGEAYESVSDEDLVRTIGAMTLDNGVTQILVSGRGAERPKVPGKLQATLANS